MAKVITVTPRFLENHPRKRVPTRFPEKVIKSLYDQKIITIEKVIDLSHELKLRIPLKIDTAQRYLKWIRSKGHTVRAGKRWKVGDMASLRVWGNDINPKSGRSGPRHSKQITIADVPIVKIWDIEIDQLGVIAINGTYTFCINDEGNDLDDRLAHNDGLSQADFYFWFKPYLKKKSFSGQVICWDDRISYE